MDVSEISSKDEKGTIKQGTIAQFMRKRTQLVGFEFGHWKHTQYCAEFLDNALDAIESFQWKELKKSDSSIAFTLDQELSLENLSFIRNGLEEQEKNSLPLDSEFKKTLMQEVGITPSDKENNEVKITDSKKNAQKEEIIKKDEIEVEEEVRKITEEMEELLKPVEDIIDLEPIVIIRLREFEPPAFLTAELSQKNVMGYTFEIFDNGIGMAKVDLKKFGKYLASSKSLELKQTRGSQGFGAPSAFSDAQNTTGMPIVAISKTAKTIYATVSEFFTTSKNEKKYIISPTDVDCPFLHGTYIKLNYLNVKYKRGYVDYYVKETALMNPHVTIIYIDPYGEQHIYPRKVSSFPIEPKYAKPHPSSVNIGDLQDLITKSNNLTISAFLQENFVRVSAKTAKEIITIAERDLQDKLNLLILKNGFVNIIQKKADKIYFLRYEKRVFGKAKKKRDKLVPYLVEAPDIKEKYWNLISNYKQCNKNIEKLLKEIKKINTRIEKVETKKEIKSFENQIKKLLKEKDNLEKEKEKIKKDLSELFTHIGDGFIEEKDEKIISDYEDLVNQVQISKTKPSELTNDQFNSLFLAFKSVKYMAPPTDTAIPVGETVLENTLIKELGLRISENLDDFDVPVDDILQTSQLILEEKKKEAINQNPKSTDKDFKDIEITNEEIKDFSIKILKTFDVNGENISQKEFKPVVESLLNHTHPEPNAYAEFYEYFIQNFTVDDDFVAAETRPPTSGKGLAYVVEAVMAYSNNLEVPKRSYDVLSRFVNRTPKLRDSADCAITKAVQSVNWKNYKLETYDNGLPKGPIKLLVNVSGPFVHLMFKSQSKNSLADDENLIKEIKYCLEAIGRRLRTYLNRRQAIKKSEKRASLIEKYIPPFVKSLCTIINSGESKYRGKISEKELMELMKNAITKKTPSKITSKAIIKQKPQVVTKPVIQKEVKEKKELIGEKPKVIKELVVNFDDMKKWTIVKLREYCRNHNIEIPSRISKVKIIEIIKSQGKAPKLVQKTLIKPIKKEEKEKTIEKELKTPEIKIIDEEQEKIASIKESLQIERVDLSEKSLNRWTIKELREYAKEHGISLPSKAKKSEIIEKIRAAPLKKEISAPKVKEIKKPEPLAPGTIAEKRERLRQLKGELQKQKRELQKPKPIIPPKPEEPQESQENIVTNEKILAALSKTEWQPLTSLIYKLKIKDMMIARFLQIKLKNLERSGLVEVDVRKGKKFWKLK